MFWLQIQHEVKQFVRNPFALLLFAILAALLAFGFWNGAQRVKDQRLASEKTTETQLAKFNGMQAETDSINRQLKPRGDAWWLDPSNPLVVGAFRRGGTQACVEPAPLALIAAGNTDLAPDLFQIGMLGFKARSNNGFENPVNMMVGTFDPAFVITYLLPLFVLALAFNLISSEKEQGTLTMLLAQPHSTRKLFFSKMMARFVLLALMMTAVLLVLFASFGANLSQVGVWQTCLSTALYAFLWFLLALCINMLGKSSAYNALACIGGWLLLAVIMPVFVNLLGEKIRPIPSRAIYINTQREADRLIAAKRPELIEQYYRENPQLERKQDANKTWRDYWLEEFAVQDYEKRQQKQIREAFEQKVNSQGTFVQRARALSPALVIDGLLTDLAGTSRKASLAMQNRVEMLQNDWLAFFKPKFLADEKLTVADYEKIKAFPVQIAPVPIPETNAWVWLFTHCAILMGIVYGISRLPQRNFS